MEAQRSFARAAEEASRSEWTYDEERKELETTLRAVSKASTDARDAVIAAAQARAGVFALLKKLTLELSAATASRLGADAPWDAAVAARVPDTNVNVARPGPNSAAPSRCVRAPRGGERVLSFARRAGRARGVLRAPPRARAVLRVGAGACVPRGGRGCAVLRAPRGRAPVNVPFRRGGLSPSQVALGLQRGKSTVQLSCVPDDSSALLGASGFNKPKVGAGDLAVSWKGDV